MPSHYKINGDKVKHNGKKNGKGMDKTLKKRCHYDVHEN